MKSSHSRSKKMQTALLYRRKLYCIAESFTAQQKVLLYSKKVSLVVETREKFILQ